MQQIKNKMRVMEHFNLRVYGVLVNESKEVLISREVYKGLSFTKFPGGGLCLGESLPDGLIREFKEECNLDIEVEKLLHVTDTFVPSAFDNSQVIGVYYKVRCLDFSLRDFKLRNFDLENDSSQSFHWVEFDKLAAEDFYFEMDQQAWRHIKNISN
jgi:8-oxo-dGTP pyrophosphatase MutT (NUDIX family)